MVLISFAGQVYDEITDLIRYLDHPFLVGLGYIILWALIISIIGIFVYSSIFVSYWVAIWVVGILVAFEVICVIGSAIKGPDY